MSSEREISGPERLVRFCGADCGDCTAYRRFLVGDDGGLVNAETRYRCCWLSESYPEGIDCPIKICCEDKGIQFCGYCDQFEQCVRMSEFYSQPGYDELEKRMLDQIEGARMSGASLRSWKRPE